MSTTALQKLVDYLKETLTLENRRWVAEHLVTDTQPRKYTQNELIETAEEGRCQIAQGEYYSTDEVLAYCMEDKESNNL